MCVGINTLSLSRSHSFSFSECKNQVQCAYMPKIIISRSVNDSMPFQRAGGFPFNPPGISRLIFRED